MSGYQELPSAEDYVTVMHDMHRVMQRDGSDLYDSLQAFKVRHQASESFYKLAHNAARTGFALEPYGEDELFPIDSQTRRAKAFVQGILTAEMINVDLFNEEFRHTAFLWLVSTFPDHEDTDASTTYQVHLQDSLTKTHEAFSESLYPVSTELLDEWSQRVVDADTQRYFRIGAGVNMAAAYYYQSNKNDRAQSVEVHSGGEDG